MTIAGVKLIDQVLRSAGIEPNGQNPWDIQIKSSSFYQKVLSKWSLGFGESYMDGDWECEKIDVLATQLLKADINETVQGPAKLRALYEVLYAKLLNLQSKTRAFQVGETHYDIGNDLFEAMLDKRMMYSCGYWENAKTLDDAQEQKLDLICKKLELKPDESLLEIGCGWGGLLKFAAQNYGIKGLGITISKEQKALAEARCAGLPVEIKLIDYRDLSGSFNKIVSVGMFEHVGEKNYRAYFSAANRLLKDDGLFLLHTIGSDVTTKRTDPWIDSYIFKNGKIPSAKEISNAIEGIFLIEDWHNFGQDYDKTLMAWHERFENAWPLLSKKYSLRFYRMWRYYLLSCAGYFRSRQGQLWQIVLSKRSREETYRSYRPATAQHSI